MRIIERRIILIGLIVYGLLGVAAWFGLYQPRLRARHRTAVQVAELKKQLADTEARVRQAPRLRQRKAELETAIQEIWARVVPRAEMLLTLRQLAQEAQQEKVRFLEITPPGLDTLLQEESQAAAVRAVPFLVRVQGRYLDIGQYVEGLVRFPYFVRVPDFEISARDDIRPEVEAKLLVNIYASSLAGGGRL